MPTLKLARTVNESDSASPFAIAVAAVPAQPNAPIASSTRVLHVLHVDDDELFRRLVRRVLSRAGHQVTSLCDAGEACASLAGGTEDYDLIVTDHSMPGMCGLDFVRWLRRAGRVEGILVFTSSLTPELRRDYVAEGTKHVLDKGASFDELVNVAELAARPALSRIF